MLALVYRLDDGRWIVTLDGDDAGRYETQEEAVNKAMALHRATGCRVEVKEGGLGTRTVQRLG